MRIALAACLCLAACNTAGPYFRGLPATRVTVAGSTFDVRVRGDLAEALRVNRQYAPRFGPIRARAAFAMEQVSGCTVTEVRGDQALALGKLSCRGRPAAWRGQAEPVSYSCLDINQWVNDRLGISYAEFECDPL